MTIPGWYWVALVAGGLGIPEVIALLNKQRGDTFSEHVWKWFAIRQERRTAWAVARRIILIAVMVWLTVHFVTGG